MRWFRWLRSLLALRRLSRSQRVVRDLSRRLNAARLDFLRLQKEWEEADKRWSFLSLEMESLRQRIQDRLTEMDDLRRQWQEGLDELRKENQLMADVTIPTLVAEHKLILARIDHRTAVEARGRGMLDVREDEGERFQ